MEQRMLGGGEKPKMGAPELYSIELADKVCHLIGTTDRGLRSICLELGIKSTATVFNWMDRHEDFLNQYTRAKQLQAHYMAEAIIDISDEEITKGDIAAVQRNKLRVESRKWAASKLLPKTYGNNTNIEHEVKHTVSIGADKMKRLIELAMAEKEAEDKNSEIEEAEEIEDESGEIQEEDWQDL